jgi:hypothetical protein
MFSFIEVRPEPKGLWAQARSRIPTDDDKITQLEICAADGCTLYKCHVMRISDIDQWANGIFEGKNMTVTSLKKANEGDVWPVPFYKPEPGVWKLRIAEDGSAVLTTNEENVVDGHFVELKYI